MEQKKFQVINTINCRYVYNKDAQKLMSMKPQRIVFYLETGEMKQLFNLGGELPNVDLDTNYEFYANEEAFKNGEQLSKDRAISEWTLADLLAKLFRESAVHNDQSGPYVWTYENGEATKWRLEEHTKTVSIDYNDKNCNAIDCELPKAYYDVEEVYRYNDYIFQGEDGKPKVREGVYKRLLLTDEQNALLDKLQAVLDECAEAKIAIEFDTYDYEVVAFNAGKIKEYSYDPIIDEEKEAAYELDLSNARRIRGIGDVNQDSDFKFVIEKPATE